ncbi:MAG: hypothetical protein F6K07_33305 [Okeania sp. SIO1H5]|uniref:2-phosphosulfolactate phosphatase n=1 Tax=Okeania sp. SIO1H5 TaxID=2607777 RepID=UPI0013BE341F|nr:2-phosphosulfolactate phosphatase [Okeania sp. SIO1H5]NET23866.1 hypothetical protein [Okeania sp. SIO1H5]
MKKVFTQNLYDIRCEWGPNGAKAVSPDSDVVIIVDILSFTTSIDLITSQGGIAFPYQWRSDTVYDYAKTVNAEVANPQNANGYSLSPMTLERIPSKSRFVLPSPNGSYVTTLTGGKTTIAGSIRNCRAVADKAMRLGKRISIIPCGERWHHEDDLPLRPCLEDQIGAGSIIQYLTGSLSPEAKASLAVYKGAADNLFDHITSCSSGREKNDKGKNRDVFLASSINSSSTVPILLDAAYQAA